MARTSPLAVMGVIAFCFVMAAALVHIGDESSPRPTSIDEPAPAPTPVVIPSRSPVPVPSFDGPLTDDERGHVMLAVLLNSIPGDLTLPQPPIEIRYDASGPAPVQGFATYAQDGGTRYVATTEAYRDGPYGRGVGTISLVVFVGPGASPVVADPCTIPGLAKPPANAGPDLSCRLLTTVSGVTVRWSSVYGWRWIAAEADYPGVTVFAVQEPFDVSYSMQDHLVGLDTPILSDDRQLAELVATPALRQLAGATGAGVEAGRVLALLPPTGGAQ